MSRVHRGVEWDLTLIIAIFQPSKDIQPVLATRHCFLVVGHKQVTIGSSYHHLLFSLKGCQLKQYYYCYYYMQSLFSMLQAGSKKNPAAKNKMKKLILLEQSIILNHRTTKNQASLWIFFLGHHTDSQHFFFRDKIWCQWWLCFVFDVCAACFKIRYYQPNPFHQIWQKSDKALWFALWWFQGLEFSSCIGQGKSLILAEQKWIKSTRCSWKFELQHPDEWRFLTLLQSGNPAWAENNRTT